MQPKTFPSSFRLGPELEAEIAELAESLGISRSQVVKKAVKHFIARQNHIDSVLAEARKSYADFKTTGMAVPWREASQWIIDGGKGDRPVPRDMRK